MQKLGLGTVQWGTAYGVTNTSGQTPLAEVARILDAAGERGIRLLDTASLYGEAELVLGRYGVGDFLVVSKTPRLADLHSASDAMGQMRRALEASLHRLGATRLHGYLLHQPDDLEGIRGEWVVSALQQLKVDGLVSNVGVSVYDPAQVDRMLELFIPDLVQLPVNVLDQRFVLDGTLDRLHKLGVEIHVRSAFLQGLLLMPLKGVHRYFDPIRSTLQAWHGRLQRDGVSAVSAALAFVRDLPQVNVVVVGVEDLGQFHQVAHAMEVGRCPHVVDLACEDPAYINPSRWELS